MGMPIILISLIASILNVIQICAMPIKQGFVAIQEKMEFSLIFIIIS